MKDSDTTVEQSLKWALGQNWISIAAVHARVLAKELAALRAEVERLRRQDREASDACVRAGQALGYMSNERDALRARVAELEGELGLSAYTRALQVEVERWKGFYLSAEALRDSERQLLTRAEAALRLEAAGRYEARAAIRSLLADLAKRREPKETPR